jgi:predicted PhzF superfamily epimerase YddE/YHI9
MFVLPPATPEADYRLRIFTPGGELPFAGHPALGSARACLDHGGAPQHAGRIVQECGAGLISVRHGEGGLSFAAPPFIRHGAIEDVYADRIVAAFGIERDRVLATGSTTDPAGPWSSCPQPRRSLPSNPTSPSSRPRWSARSAPTPPAPSTPSLTPSSCNLRPRRRRARGPGVRQHERLRRALAHRHRRRPRRLPGLAGPRVGRAGTVEITADPDGTVWVGGAVTACIRGSITP